MEEKGTELVKEPVGTTFDRIQRETVRKSNSEAMENVDCYGGLPQKTSDLKSWSPVSNVSFGT